MSHRWYYQLLMEEFGPVTESAIHELTKDGTLGSSDLVRREDSEAWITVAQLPTPANDETSPDGPQDIADLEELSFSFEETASAPRRSTSPLPSSHTPEQSTPPVQVVQSSVKAGVTYYCKSLGQVLGPMTMSDLVGMAESGALSQEDFVRHGEDGPWQIASEVPELAVSIFQHTNSPEIPAAPEVPVRRLFQTAGRPKSASTNDANDKTDNNTTDNNAAGTAADSGSVGQSETQSESQVEPTGESPNESKKKSESSSAGDKGEKTAGAATKRSKLKRREKSKSDKAEDALLNEIFGEVFADGEKSTHPGMPAAATGPAPKPVSANAASDSSVESSTSAKTAKGSTVRRKPTDSKSADPMPVAQASTADKQDSASENSTGSVIAATSVTTAAASEVAPVSNDATSPASEKTPATVSAAPAPATAIPPSPVVLASTPAALSSPTASTPTAPSRPRRSFSFDGPVRTITLSVVAIAIVGGLIMTFGLPSFSFNSAGKHAERMATVAAEFKAAGETPAMGPWESLCLKSRAEFVPLYKGMLEAGASGPANVACMEGMKAIIAIASTKPEETDRRKELLQNLDKALADMKK